MTTSRSRPEIARGQRADEDRATIRAAVAYRAGTDASNLVFLGVVTMAEIYAVLRIRYGQDDFDPALNDATREELDAVLVKCARVIEHMQQRREAA